MNDKIRLLSSSLNGITAYVDMEGKRISAFDNNKIIYNKECHDLNKELNILTKNKNKLFEEINDLRNNKTPIDNKYREFKEYLITNLKDKYRRDIDIKFLCECIEIDSQ